MPPADADVPAAGVEVRGGAGAADAVRPHGEPEDARLGAAQEHRPETFALAGNRAVAVEQAAPVVRHQVGGTVPGLHGGALARADAEREESLRETPGSHVEVRGRGGLPEAVNNAVKHARGGFQGFLELGEVGLVSAGKPDGDVTAFRVRDGGDHAAVRSEEAQPVRLLWSVDRVEEVGALGAVLRRESPAGAGDDAVARALPGPEPHGDVPRAVASLVEGSDD